MQYIQSIHLGAQVYTKGGGADNKSNLNLGAATAFCGQVAKASLEKIRAQVCKGRIIY